MFFLVSSGKVVRFSLGSTEPEVYDDYDGKFVIDIAEGFQTEHAVVLIEDGAVESI